MIYAVSGMARTGTSMMMHALIKGGIPAIYDIGKADARLLYLASQGYDSNHDGLFELYKKNLYRRFPAELDGEAVKIHDWQWSKLTGYAEAGLSVVYMQRNKADVLKSIVAFTGDKELSQFERRWDNQSKVIMELTKRPDIKEVVVFQYEELVAKPLPHFEFLVTKGFPINPVKSASIVNPEYHHFRSK
jgi:hypothetical protein